MAKKFGDFLKSLRGRGKKTKNPGEGDFVTDAQYAQIKKLIKDQYRSGTNPEIGGLGAAGNNKFYVETIAGDEYIVDLNKKTAELQNI